MNALVPSIVFMLLARYYILRQLAATAPISAATVPFQVLRPGTNAEAQMGGTASHIAAKMTPARPCSRGTPISSHQVHSMKPFHFSCGMGCRAHAFAIITGILIIAHENTEYWSFFEI